MSRTPPPAWCLLLLLLAAAPAAPGAATTVRLRLPVETVRPGGTFLAGVELTMKPGWHTYWRHGGDSGAGTRIEWSLPPGFSAGEIRWPAPARYVDQDLVTYVYHGAVTLLVPVTVAPDAPRGPAELSAQVSWLECEKLCLPGRGEVRAALVVAETTKPSADAAALAEAERRLPPAAAPGTAQAFWDGPPNGAERPLVILWHDAGAAGTPDFFWAGGTTDFEVPTLGGTLPAPAGQVALRRVVSRSAGDWPREITGLLVRHDGRGRPLAAVAVNLPVAEQAPPGLAAAQAGSAPAGAAPPRRSLAGAVLLGLLGGVILNIMPCVLPVIALKILGFVQEAGRRPEVVRRLGLVYALGVWCSFLVLAGVVIAVKRATGLASWGMQFSSPVFLVALTTLVTLVALSLFGVFEIHLGAAAADRAGGLAAKGGTGGAFFNGVLAVALATPCTAPFLAPALGFAFTSDAMTIVIVFSAVAAGLAAPYVLLSWNPRWLRFLPKPGAWMERFKVAMGFPMLATAVWLYTLAAPRFGEAGWLGLGLFLVLVAAAAWVGGEFLQRGAGRPAAWLALAALLLAAYFGVLERQLAWRAPVAQAATSDPAREGGIAWRPWSPAAVEAARRAGRVVFVDFTADWCLTCKLNEKSSIEIGPVRAKLRELEAVALLADNTLAPPDIAAELQRHGRAGVPLVLVYPREAAQPPLVLPEVLTPGIVLDALARAAQ